MFGQPDHDAAAVATVLEGAPAAGFFAAGEIGPVGGELPPRLPRPLWQGLRSVNLQGRTVLLTGASGGLGQAIARRLRASGATLVLSGRRADVLEPLARELGGQTIAADLSAREDVERVVSERARRRSRGQRLPADGPVLEYTPEQIDRAIDVNLRAPVRLARLVAEDMVRRGAGYLVFVSSLSGKVATARVGPVLGDQVRPAPASPRGCARTCAAPASACPASSRGDADAGMFAERRGDAAIRACARPDDVRAPSKQAIERDVHEIDVADFGSRVWGMVGQVAPAAMAWVSHRFGGQRHRGRDQRQRGPQVEALVGPGLGGPVARRGDRGEDLVGQLGPFDRPDRHGRDAHDDLVAVDFLESEMGSSRVSTVTARPSTAWSWLGRTSARSGAQVGESGSWSGITALLGTTLGDHDRVLARGRWSCRAGRARTPCLDALAADRPAPHATRSPTWEPGADEDGPGDRLPSAAGRETEDHRVKDPRRRACAARDRRC